MPGWFAGRGSGLMKIKGIAIKNAMHSHFLFGLERQDGLY
ncbi:hypothetical protein GJA_2388 [Janthinobacterium agaricidamnosum NBRC 102515 = DSM 9628]|uniref:Uncharacterized protein n=1 Tax=Janthinobacterium agaricidamnosum NBRC 102515 = DSM 9628 TaxID=1349767 RepID=W0V573_9BURK|nr:hypothetical protein GJA_2388 [Janthinobacterium agaricidamnosum NBRC 102515 = DSM 9628]